VLDLLIINVIYGVGLALLQFAINNATPLTVELQNGYWWVIAGEFVWAAIYFGACWVTFSRSPGMSVMGLRIVRTSGAELDHRHALIRLVAFPLGFLTFGLGFLGIVFGRRHRAIYDRIADTTVVYDWDAEAARLRSLAKRGERRRDREAEPLREG
jgi:uncharacterized RDD family membrane protein YckC